MKSNIYSILIFLIGLLTTYIVTKNFQEIEIKAQDKEVSVQSQAITYTIQQQITHHTQQLAATAQRWHSIEQINLNWQYDINLLTTRLPHLSNLNIYLLEKQPTLSIDSRVQNYFENDSDLIRQAQQLRPLAKKLYGHHKGATRLSTHQIQPNNQAISYLHTPIYIGTKLIGYLEATLNVTKLLDEQVARFQITYPFSLSEGGRSIYSVLPKNVQINNVNQQFTISLPGHNWKLMLWPLHQHFFYQYIQYIGLLLSMLISQLFYVVFKNKNLKQKLTLQKLHLTAINQDFTASKSKLIQSNKLSSLGEIATGIAHEINQPLQVICIHADMCQESLRKQNYGSVDKSFHIILSQVERIEKIVKQVGSFARDSELDQYTHEVPATIFENVINIVINQFNQESVELRQILPASLPSILCNKTQIEQVLVNLLINAKDAVEGCEEKIVFIKAHDKQGKLYIEVSDTGSGIELAKLDDVFTPFYTTKALGKGTGLGLSISYSIIHQHKGELEVTSEIGKGSTFTIILPLN